MEWVQLKNKNGDAFAIRTDDIQQVFMMGDQLFIRVKGDVAEVEIGFLSFQDVMSRIYNSANGIC